MAKQGFIEQLMQTLPADFAAQARLQFCGPSGSDAVEAALKLFKTVTGRCSVIAFHGAYHGMTLGSLSLMGNLGPKQPVSGLAPETHFFPYPHDSRCPFGVGGSQGEAMGLNYLENALNDPESGITKPAMVILEAVQGEGGCIPAPAHWLQRLRAITQAHQIPLVIDEVQTGFGRTGKMFAVEHYGIEPDIICMAKGIASGFPFSALGTRRELDDKWPKGSHGGTYGGNAMGCAAALATIELMEDPAFLANVVARGQQLQAGLLELQKEHPGIAQVRALGLMIATEFDDAARVSAITKHCLEEGHLILMNAGTYGRSLRWMPPLVVSEREIDLALAAFAAALKATA